FTADQTAAILGVDRQELSGLIDTAGRQIGAQVTSSVLIIEDEPIIAMDLEALVAGLGHRVVGNARTHSEAVAMAKATQPGLV
ncbi:response regulator, partial [Mycobacterium tuberculosis]|nr:response regulator [Mycobacterium tuberculosis]